MRLEKEVPELITTKEHIETVCNVLLKKSYNAEMKQDEQGFYVYLTLESDCVMKAEDVCKYISESYLVRCEGKITT